MVDLISSTNSSPEPASSSSVQPTSQNATTAEASATANATKKDYDMDMVVRSTADLKTKAPEVWDKMMEGIAQNIISQMRKRQERLKEMMRKARQE
jgi:DNA polymerase II small subunit/DNA polymerase delta subunit B